MPKISRQLLSASSVALALTLSTGAFARFTDVGGILLGDNLNSRSASLADIDNDNDLDIYFQGATGSQRIYRNDLDGGSTIGFTDVTSSLLPAGLQSSWSAAWGDMNGDRLIDVFIGQTNSSLTGDTGTFLLNAGSTLGFIDQSALRGLDFPAFPQNVAWSDIDGDRDLDLLVAMEGPERHEIYLHEEDGSFTPVGAAVGIQQATGTKAYGMALGDTDGDGDIDIYISTCRGDNNIQNHFYENQLAQTGTLGFIDIADTNGTQFMTNSYGTEFHDLDDDGDLDLFMTGADGEPSKIFRNDGGNQFTDVDTITGVPLLTNTGTDLNGSRMVDYDNDGDLDLFLHDQGQNARRGTARQLYRNEGDWNFTDVTFAEGLLENNRGSYDSTWGDLDRDGDQDLVATTDSSAGERLYISDASENGNHWLYVELEGSSDNTSGVGSTLYATVNKGTPDEITYRREANTNAGTFNQSDVPVHFGLGALTGVDELRVVWTDGRVQVLSDIGSDQYLTVEYADLLTGDFNGDGAVDAADYTVWRDANGFIGFIGFGNAADANGDGAVDSGDYDLWRDNFGATLSASTIPEPGTLLLVGIACLAGSPRRAALA